MTYFIGDKYWRKGYASEPVRAVIALAFEAMHLDKVQARCMVSNPASLRVMQKCGLTYEGKSKHAVIKEGRYLDVWHAAIIRGDYLEI